MRQKKFLCIIFLSLIKLLIWTFRLFCDFSLWVTFFDFANTYFGELTARGSFWYIKFLNIFSITYFEIFGNLYSKETYFWYKKLLYLWFEKLFRIKNSLGWQNSSRLNIFKPSWCVFKGLRLLGVAYPFLELNTFRVS